MIQTRTAFQILNSVSAQFDTDKRNAFYLAGKAASIYLGNQKKQLPAVYFRIESEPQEGSAYRLGVRSFSDERWSARLVGGRLIDHLDVSYDEATRYFDAVQKEQFRIAFDADMINLMAGALAEAMYLFGRFGDRKAADAVDLNTWYDCVDPIDMILLNEYLDCLVSAHTSREQKLCELFVQAAAFINRESHWAAITALADFIHRQAGTHIVCEDIIARLDSVL